jgi:VWFA-related protein
MATCAHRGYIWHPLSLLACVALSAPAAFPQKPPQPNQIQATQSPEGKPGYTIKARVPLTILDIVVTDDKGHTVHNLKQSDFSIFEDNQPMTPKSFEEHRSDEAQPSVPALAKQALPPNTFANAVPPPGDRPVNLLLLDSLNTPIAVQAIVRQQMLDYVKKMPSGTRMAIFGLTTHLFLIQGFTSDPEVLKAALTSSPKMFPQVPPLEDVGQEPPALEVPQSMEEQGGHMAMRGQYTFDAINQIARYLSGIPGRKNLIWFSGAFPTQFPPEPRTPDFYSVPQIFDFTDGVNAMGDMLARAHITVYSIEPRGIDRFIATRKGAIEFAEHGTMDTIADLTGGKNFHNTNGMTEAVDEAVNTGANFYTVTYTPSNQKLDTRFHSITVKLNRPDLHLAYRNGYYAVDPETTVSGRKIQKVTPMQSALMRGALEPTQILFKVKVSQSPATDDTVPAGNKPDPKLKPPYRRYSISYVIDVNGIDFTPSIDTNYRGDFEFGVMVYNADGDAIVNSASKTVSPILPPAVYQSMLRGGANAHQEIAVPATGDYFLRIAVHDLASDRVGAIEIPTASITPTPETTPAASPPTR